jgi:CheY-like chemotaxis protein
VTFRTLRHLKTLLIDDDEFVRDSIRLMFESRSCCIRTVETAEEALEILREQDFDVIITDYRLPGMDGLEFCRQLRVIRPRAMTVLITAYGSPALSAEAGDLGIQELVEKPITSEAIEASLSRLLKRAI